DPLKPSIITSTAEWTKFTPSMIKALYDRDSKNEKEDLKFIAKEFNVQVKDEILALFDLKNSDEKVFEARNIKKEILDWMQK
ncbi:threonine synthase, partial [Campylobacter jejuni]|nr:threonine synthase [Campylobacter jejuni]